MTISTLPETMLKGTPASYKTLGPRPFMQVAMRIAGHIQWGTMIVALPDGRVFKFEGREKPEEVGVLLIKDWRFARKMILGGTIGLYEAFEKDMWDSPDIAQFLRVGAANAEVMQGYFLGNVFVRQLNNLFHTLNKNTKNGSRRNIMAHYDLGNSFYKLWLDPTMTYSSAKFAHPGQDLADAQTNKYRALAESIDLKPGERVLEIGSGWGGFAEYAAREVGASVTGITISKEQYDFAQERMFREGLNEKVEIRLQDYRDVDEQFDKAASIEMFEAVGKEFWPIYFHKLRDSLKPGGVAGLQIITIADDIFPYYEKASDFIQRYIFPGGMLPSPGILRDQVQAAGLSWRREDSFGLDYADTLNAWHKSFLAAWDDIREMGFDDRFKKLWRYYLAYCEAGFRGGTTDVAQVAVARA
ncbi:MAG: cyclopropane-fatty-acyl-phospholipid synthase family protein [Pseudomonadota bacterium]